MKVRVEGNVHEPNAGCPSDCLNDVSQSTGAVFSGQLRLKRAVCAGRSPTMMLGNRFQSLLQAWTKQGSGRFVGLPNVNVGLLGF